jgi:hypothetical protein
MPFSQLHYTSCERGLSGHSGFQFCAMTPGVDGDVMREVERLTIYEPPLRPAAQDEPSGGGDYPVNLLFTVSKQSETPIIARTVYTGIDFSHRSGNYFVHALIGDAQATARLPVLPIELWDAPFWVSRQGEATLPLLPDSLPPGSISAAALASRWDTGQEDVLARLLVAVAEAMTGGQQVALVDADTSAVCGWIAAVCYLLGPDLGARVTFATYSHDPRRCTTHIIGMVDSAALFQGSMTAHTRLFDFAKGVIPDVAHWPSTVLLARVGVARAFPLWELAKTLEPAAADSLVAAFPVLASAALLQEHQLAMVEVAAAISWLASTAGPRAAGQFPAAVQAALRHPVELLTVERQTDLVDLALRADPAAAIADHHLAGQVEHTLATRMLARLGSGERLRDTIVFRTDHGRKRAVQGCTTWLPRLNAAQVIDLLAWAAAAGVQLPDDVVRSTGENTILALLLDGRAPTDLKRVARHWPSLRRGLLDGLATMPAAVRRTVLTGPGAGLFSDEDFAGHADLHEIWLILLANQGRMSKADACKQLMALRRDQGHIPALDRHLFERLWPAKEWTAAEAAEIAAGIPAAELSNEIIARQLVRIIHDVSQNQHSSGWTDLILRLSEVPERILPAHETTVVHDLASAIRLVRQASNNQAALDDCVASYDSRTPEARTFLGTHLPSLILDWHVPSLRTWNPSLGYVLADCSLNLHLQVCTYIENLLVQEPHKMRFAAWIWVTMRQLTNMQKNTYASYLSGLALRPVHNQWSRQERSQMTKYVKQLQPKGRSTIDLWMKQGERSQPFWRRNRILGG